MNKHSYLLATIAMLSALPASAAITIVDSYQHTLSGAIAGTIVNDPGGSTKTITNASVGNLVASGSDKLVIGVNSRSNVPFTVTYAGFSMTLAVSQAASTNNGFAAIFYLDNPSADGDFVFSSLGSNSFDRASMHAWALDGTAAGTAASSVTDTSTTGDPLSLSMTGGGFFIGSIGANGGAPTTTFSPNSGSDFLYAYANTTSNAYAAWLTDTSGTYSMLRTNTSTAGGAGVMAQFIAIPEPSPLAMGILLTLGLCLRRRR